MFRRYMLEYNISRSCVFMPCDFDPPAGGLGSLDDSSVVHMLAAQELNEAAAASAEREVRHRKAQALRVALAVVDMAQEEIRGHEDALKQLIRADSQNLPYISGNSRLPTHIEAANRTALTLAPKRIETLRAMQSTAADAKSKIARIADRLQQHSEEKDALSSANGGAGHLVDGQLLEGALQLQRQLTKEVVAAMDKEVGELEAVEQIARYGGRISSRMWAAQCWHLLRCPPHYLRDCVSLL